MRYNAAHVVTSASNIMTSLFSYVSMILIISVFIFFLYSFYQSFLSFSFFLYVFPPVLVLFIT